MKENTTKPTSGSPDKCGNEEENNDQEVNNDEELDDFNESELETLNTQLDQLNSVLDTLEQKNDDIQAQLKVLLQLNRAARQQFQAVESETPLPETN